jgi:hypothetical protein
MLTQRASFFPLLDHESSQLSQNTICAMASHNRRRSSIDRASVESILTSGATGQPAAPPSPHVGNSPNMANFVTSLPPRPAPRHSRALSYTPHRPNHLSLSFPVATSSYGTESTRPTPTSSNTSSFPATPADSMPAPSPNDPTGFLVALAGQERKVLELKEELQKAEVELTKLKKQWAVHEAHKKTGEIRHLEQLQPLQGAVTSGGSPIKEAGTSLRQSVELDRRKALLSNINIPKESRRKVISGGHARALSLLSPDRSNYTQPFPPVQESRGDGNGLPTSTTMPDTSQGITKISSNRARHSYQSGVTHGAKQIAEDVKAGLWTFLEDLRQATVGDEAVNGTTNRASLDPSQPGPNHRGSKSSLLSNERGRPRQSPRANTSTRTWDSLTGTNLAHLDASGALWPDADQANPPSKAPNQKIGKILSLAPQPLDDLDEDWSNWDSPVPKSPIRWSGSTEMSDPTTPSHEVVDDRGIK